MLNLNAHSDAADGEIQIDPHGYEPWVFRTMLGELAVGELGIGFIYNLMDRLAERYELSDVIVALADESFGSQTFRLGGRVEDVEHFKSTGPAPGVYCEPAIVPDIELEAVRAAAHLALSLQLARFRAGQDALTNIANRRSFDSALQVATSRSARYGWPFTLVIVDLDDFKSLNDERGHEYGDYMLRQFGFALRRAVRGGDTPARIGGDEFAVILNNAEGNEALGFTDRLRLQLKSAGVPVDFTIGTASSPRESTDPVELYRLADSRLYEKKGGSRG